MKKKVQIGRSRMVEELARPTWSAQNTAAPQEKKHTAAPQKTVKMKKQEQKVETISVAPVTQKTLRVAAYARVSTDLDSQETSIENQREHYLHLIEANPDWKLVGIYEESGVSGTKADTRPELQKLLHDCEAGAMDVIITKSISRFARNTSECLEMVRKLTGLGIRLIFEKENIDTETIAFNLLRMIGQESLRHKQPDRRKVRRRRLRTVISNLMLCGSHVTQHARKLIMSLGMSNTWRHAFWGIWQRFVLT